MWRQENLIWRRRRTGRIYQDWDYIDILRRWVAKILVEHFVQQPTHESVPAIAQVSLPAG